jgi:hypothetical protein
VLPVRLRQLPEPDPAVADRALGDDRQSLSRSGLAGSPVFSVT